jgi:CRP-like cAMP-binding protein
MNRECGTAGERKCIDRARAALAEVIETRSFESGSLLFKQDELPLAVFFLRSGSVRLKREGIDPQSPLCVARPGDVIGVTNAVSGRPYDMNALVTKASVLEVVSREDFLRLMTESPGLHLEVVRMLSIDLGRCYEVLRTLGPKTRHRGANEVNLECDDLPG